MTTTGGIGIITAIIDTVSTRTIGRMYRLRQGISQRPFNIISRFPRLGISVIRRNCLGINIIIGIVGNHEHQISIYCDGTQPKLDKRLRSLCPIRALSRIFGGALWKLWVWNCSHPTRSDVSWRMGSSWRVSRPSWPPLVSKIAGLSLRCAHLPKWAASPRWCIITMKHC